MLDECKMHSEASHCFEGALCRDTGLAAGLRISCVQEATRESLSPRSGFPGRSFGGRTNPRGTLSLEFLCRWPWWLWLLRLGSLFRLSVTPLSASAHSFDGQAVADNAELLQRPVPAIESPSLHVHVVHVTVARPGSCERPARCPWPGAWQAVGLGLRFKHAVGRCQNATASLTTAKYWGRMAD